MNPRLRRLASDAQRVQQVFADHPFIRVEQAQGSPPERYTVRFEVRSLLPPRDAAPPQVQVGHTAEVFLSLDYPRRPPFCRMLTPVFHPNIDAQKVCIGDHWSAGQQLAGLIVRLGEMLCYQSYNTQSPLNAEAAAWTAQHLDQLPLQSDDLSKGL